MRTEIIDGELWVDRHVAAQFCGVTVQTFTNWVNSGDNPPPYDHERRLVSAKGLGHWVRSVQTLKKGRGGSYPFLPDISSFVINTGVSDESPETRLKRLQGDKVEMELRQSAASLVSAEDVTQAWSSVVSMAKTRLLKIPSTLSPIVTGLTDQHDVEHKLSTAIREALEELSDDGT